MHVRKRRKNRTAALAGVLLLAVLPALKGQSRRTKTNTPPPTPPAAMPVPFAVGETLRYQVLWSEFSVHAGTMDFSVAEERDFFGRLAWHFRATAHTINTTRTVYPLDDQFDSYTDASQLQCLQYELYLNEEGKTETSILRTSTKEEPVPPKVTLVRVLPGTRDPIGLLYALRAADWRHSAEFRAPAFDGHRAYEIRADVEIPSRQVTVPAGQFEATRIAVHISERGNELAGTRFWVWLAHDAARTPVLIEVEVPFGTARVELLQLPQH
ncbi:MAG: DUF3108 domain-containing protein [Candidatus Acidiferrales bacterium]